ncbi:ribosomal protein S18-alanine N-acetyltransferase [Neptuniibacter caesariensis]|uniref:[Ribosomal protein bS18]-alanine N-acetyltransferase n=1 Tax=Neptuniibacter caesariensis TaxID=207954 RepID=A0A7U8GUB7_NEPCE|nr:ribosomal protein S18-alanine N-acetyltransferase [Neptuniibacter caesariensis]EAR63025.1 RimI protein [Oceanospirillum sp. MED92] [Neptuniibacter caesariensis]
MPELIQLSSEYSDALLEMEQRCFTSPWSAQRLNEYLTPSPRKLALGLYENGLIGFAIFSIILDEAELLQIAISPLEQRKGCALNLLKGSLESLKGKGVVKLMLEVNSTNLPAVGLYKRIGFKEDGVRNGYYPSSLPGGDREDAILMSYQLG